MAKPTGKTLTYAILSIPLLLVGAVVAAVLACGLLILVWPSAHPPSDDLLIETFTTNRHDFETLVRMMSEDTANTALWKVHQDYVKYQEEGTVITERRLQEYRSLFGRLGLMSMTHYPNARESFLITVYAEGFSPEGGIYKGYEYFPEGIPEEYESSLVDSLKYDPKTHDPGTWLYREIDQHWYLWFLY
jgi:hypothetical protein